MRRRVRFSSGSSSRFFSRIVIAERGERINPLSVQLPQGERRLSVYNCDPKESVEDRRREESAPRDCEKGKDRTQSLSAPAQALAGDQPTRQRSEPYDDSATTPPPIYRINHDLRDFTTDSK